MAELPFDGKQLTKRLKPSRLRHEVRAESVDDKRASGCGPVQAPDSQLVVPETQLEPHQDNEPDHGDPLSPSSAAMLDRNSVKKSIETTEPSPFVYKPLSKESFIVESNSAPASSVGFSFGQPTKALSKTPPRAEVPTTQPTTGSSAAVHSGNDDHNPFVSPPSFPPTVVADGVSKHFSNVENRLTKDAGVPSSCVPIVADDVRGGSGQQNKPCDAFSDVPPSAQPHDSGIPRPKKTQKRQKGKKGKKIMNRKPRGVPWPPRSSVTDLSTSKPSPADDAVLWERFPMHMASPPTEQDVDQTSQALNGNVDTTETNHDEHEKTLEHTRCLVGDWGIQLSRFVTREIEAVLPPEQHPTTEVYDALPDVTFQQAPGTLHDQPSLLPEWQSTVGPTVHVPGVTFDAPVEHDQQRLPAAPQTKVQSITFQQQTGTGGHKHQATGIESTNAHEYQATLPKSRLPQATKSDERKERPSLPEESVLHITNNHSQPYRIEKTQKKRRVPNDPQHPTSSAFFRNHGLAVQDDFDKTLEGLREAHHADKWRQDHDIAIQGKHFEEVKALLQDQIHQYSDMVTVWKDKYDALNASTLHLREKAKTNQKYVAGLQKDHEKLQKSAIAFQDECKKALQQKITEAEHEKESLRRELEATLESLAKGQRTLKGTVDELYVRLIISESKRKDSVESLAKQVSMYEEEKTRRKDLETMLLPSFQSVQRQLGDRSTQLVQKLEILQASVNGVASRQGRDSGVQECLDALRKLQDTPFLAVKDVQKAEGMLRFVHGGQSVENRTYSTKDIQTFVSNKLQDLRSEMLRFDEVAAENRKAQESNDGLSRELEAERYHTQKLNEQLGNARHNEEELKMQKVQLERQLADVNGIAHSHNANPPDSRQDAGDMREKIKEVEHECCVAKAEVERLQRNIQKRDRKLGDYDASVEILKNECRRLSEALKQKPPNVAQLCNEIERDIQQGFTDKESSYRNDIHRLTIERDELQALVEQCDKKIDAAKARCEQAKRDVSDIKSELEIARKEKMEVEARCKALQRTAQNQPSETAEISSMKERLRQKSAELRSKTEEFAELEGTFAQLESRRTNLQVMFEEQQTEISQQPSVIESLRQEADVERQEERKKSQAAMQLAKNKTLALKKEKEDLQAKLEQAQLTETESHNAQAAHMLERDGLRHHIADLELAKEHSATQTLRLQEEHASKMRKYEEKIDTLHRHQERSDSALKEAEAKIQLQKTEHVKKLEFDREKYEAIVRSLEEKFNKARPGLASRHTSQQQPSQSSPSQDTFTREVNKINAGKGRRKVNRGNNSILNVSEKPGTLIETSTQHSNGGRPAPPRRHSDTLFDEESHDNLGSDQLLNDQGITIVDPAAGQVEDTQEIAQGSLSFEERTKQAACASLKGSQRPNPILNDQSSLSASLSSDELTQLREESQGPRRPSTPVLHGRRRISDTQRSSQERVLETPTRSDNLSVSSFQSYQSKDRPRSQANTASRLMPPPGSRSSHFEQDKLSPVTQDKDTASDRMYSNSQNLSKVSHGSYSASVHESASAFEQTQQAAEQTELDGLDDTSHASDYLRGYKRKSALGEDTSFKRQRTSSQSPPAKLSSGSRSYSPHPPSRTDPFRTNPSCTSAASAVHSKTRKSPSQSSVSPALNLGSRDQLSSSNVGRRPASRLSFSKNGNQARNQPSTALRSSATTTAHQVYGRHQTRSKTQELERFDKEIRGQ